MVANSLPADPLPARPLGDGVNRSKFNFIREWSGCVSNFTGITKCSNMVANIFPSDPTYAPDPRGMGSIGQKSTYSEHGHVSYQIKGNDRFSNMLANILHADPPPP